jgi:NADPH2:quinone reductase
MTRTLILPTTGGAEQFEPRDAALADPAPGELRLRHLAIGLNFIDIYHRTGLYPVALPAVLGVEAAGIVEALGPGVDDLAVGDRIAYAGAIGGYAEARNLPAWRAVRVPAALSDGEAATVLTRGIAAHMLQTEVFAVGPTTTALIHSAAGGLGGLLVRLARRRGATVIATVGSDAKAAIARGHGADHVIVGRDADFVAEVRAVTGGRGVDVAYDGVGGTTLARTLACVRPFGTVASFGQAAGPIPPLAVEDLGPRRSLVLARPSVMHYMTDPVVYRRAAAAALDTGIAPSLGRSYRLADVAAAHRDLEAGATTGSVYLVP